MLVWRKQKKSNLNSNEQYSRISHWHLWPDISWPEGPQGNIKVPQYPCWTWSVFCDNGRDNVCTFGSYSRVDQTECSKIGSFRLHYLFILPLFGTKLHKEPTFAQNLLDHLWNSTQLLLLGSRCFPQLIYGIVYLVDLSRKCSIILRNFQISFLP